MKKIKSKIYNVFKMTKEEEKLLNVAVKGVLQKIKEMNLSKEVLRSLDFRQLIVEIYDKYFFIPQKNKNEPLFEDILIQKMILNHTDLIPSEFYYLTTIDNVTTWQYCNKFNSNMAEYFNKNVWEEE